MISLGIAIIFCLLLDDIDDGNLQLQKKDAWKVILNFGTGFRKLPLTDIIGNSLTFHYQNKIMSFAWSQLNEWCELYLIELIDVMI